MNEEEKTQREFFDEIMIELETVIPWEVYEIDEDGTETRVQ